MSITIRSLGAAGEVTGSKHLLEIDGTRVLIDCGAFQGKRAEADEKNRQLLGEVDPASIHALVLTHAHYDHCGLLPYLVKKGFTGNIFATSATRDLANLIMTDSAHIQARDANYLSRQAEKKGEVFSWKPLYDEFDVIKAMDQFVTVGYHRPISITDGISLEFYDAGHILGSAFARLTARDSAGSTRVIGFSGDLGRRNKPIIKDPECLDGIDVLLLESTYGDRLHEPIDNAISRLRDLVNRTVDTQGKLIIPAFAVERTQELIFYLHLLQDDGSIPEVPIWVDSPMALNATSIFAIHPECYDKETYDRFTTHAKNPFGFSALNFSRSVQDSKMLNQAKGPMIIISADGMCEFGRIQHHL
ncbi:MAG: MBL fold metallo-hydrolase, partial [Rectinema sp.]|nr:MBL fold metallo-hydrolase [Rectinema sp.]